MPVIWRLFPDPPQTAVEQWTPSDKVHVAILRSAKFLPADTWQQVEAMLTPESLAVMVGLLTVWAVAQLAIVGELADILLILVMLVGVAFVGASLVDDAHRLIRFATLSIHAKSEADIDAASREFAAVVASLGVLVLSSILFAKTLPKVFTRPHQDFPATPMSGSGPRNVPDTGFVGRYRPSTTQDDLSYTGTIALGVTDEWGNIILEQKHPRILRQYAETHERLHQFLTPKLYRLGGMDLEWLRNERGFLQRNAYSRSMLLRYLEEALAEFYATWKMLTRADLRDALTMPVRSGYVTVRGMQEEAVGLYIGSLTLTHGLYKVFYARREEFRAFLSSQAQKDRILNPPAKAPMIANGRGRMR